MVNLRKRGATLLKIQPDYLNELRGRTPPLSFHTHEKKNVIRLKRPLHGWITATSVPLFPHQNGEMTERFETGFTTVVGHDQGNHE